MTASYSAGGTRRREVLHLAMGLVVAPLAIVARSGSASATPESMSTAIRTFVGEAQPRSGRIKLDLPPLVENGNSVSLTVAVDSPMTPADFVRRIAIFNEKNPQPSVATFHLTPRSGRASVVTRIRLADSQKIVAIAELSDGTFWSAQADVIVTLAACIES